MVHPTRADVLAAYERLPLRPDAAAPDLSHDVIAYGPGLSEIAQDLGRDLGRPVVGFRTSDGWLQTASRPSSVLLLASRRDFSAESARDWVASSSRADTPRGFLLVEDAEDARFQAAKLRFAHTRVLPGDDAVVDSVNGSCGRPGDLEAARPERLSTVLASSWRLLAVGGHSDIGHMGLGSHILCGATGRERFAGRLLADGCDPDNGTCRCATTFLRTVVPVRSLRAGVVALMGCRTFDLTATESSTTNSLCASALSGHPVAVITMLGELDLRFDGVGQCARSLADGLSLGAAVQGLNRSHRIPTAYGMALVGDPALRFAPGATPAPAGPPAQVDADCRARARPLLDRCHQAIERSRAADRTRRALLKVSDKSMESDLEDALDALDRACEQVQDAAWTAIELLHEAVDYQRWHAPDRVLERLDKAIARWDDSFVAAASLVTAIDMYGALHAFARLDGFSTEGSCPRCGSQLSISRYGDPEGAGPQRVAVACWQCGPVRESARPGPEPAIAVSGTFEPGATIRPRLSVRAAPEDRDRIGHLAVVLVDRLSEEVLAVHRAECTLATLSEISLPIPADTRSDLHFLWAVWVSGLTVAFAATRVPVTRLIP